MMSVRSLEASTCTSDQYQNIYNAQIPVLIKQYAYNWPCLSDPHRSWLNLKHLKLRVTQSDSVVPIEVGIHYMDPQLRKHKISLESFLDFLIKYQNASIYDVVDLPMVYLAQHEVQDIAVLREDVEVPAICNTGKGNIYRSNIWFSGPKGSISPCHHDPFQNVLVQIIGEKEVWLIDPKHSDNLYPAVGTLQKNTSLVNFDKPDMEKFPRLANIEVFKAVLHSGDALFIPLKWWHYCKAPSISCSVNYWWL